MKNIRLLAVALVVFALLCSLGLWQVKRLHWKQDLIAQLTSRQSLPAKTLRDLVAMADDDREYTPIADKGQLDLAHPLYLQSTLNGTAGWRVIAPFTSDSGVSVLVDLGSTSSRDIQLKPQLEISGLVRNHKAARSFYDLDNDPAGNMWFWWDVPTMQKTVGLKGDVAPFVVQAFSNSSGLLPHEARIELRNQHLGYAITWFGLAAALAAVTMVFVLKRKE